MGSQEIIIFTNQKSRKIYLGRARLVRHHVPACADRRAHPCAPQWVDMVPIRTRKVSFSAPSSTLHTRLMSMPRHCTCTHFRVRIYHRDVYMAS
jgi:hypothetical protein